VIFEREGKSHKGGEEKSYEESRACLPGKGGKVLVEKSHSRGSGGILWSIRVGRGALPEREFFRKEEASECSTFENLSKEKVTKNVEEG